MHVILDIIFAILLFLNFFYEISLVILSFLHTYHALFPYNDLIVIVFFTFILIFYIALCIIRFEGFLKYLGGTFSFAGLRKRLRCVINGGLS